MTQGIIKAAHDFADMVLAQPLTKKHLLRSTWLSGSSTTVYPTEIYFPDFPENTARVTFQWGCRKNLYRPFIKRMVEKGAPVVDSGHFVPGDGSCPAAIVFFLSDKGD